MRAPYVQLHGEFWPVRVLTAEAPAVECPECKALVVMDAGTMNDHADWHARNE